MSETRAVPTGHRTLFQMADFELVIGPPLCKGAACVAPHIGRISPQITSKKTNYGSIHPPITHKKAFNGSIRHRIVHKKTLHGSISY